MEQTPPHPAPASGLHILQRSGLFDGAWFAIRNFDFADANHDALLHWFHHGWREDRWPNPYFDPAFYRRANPDAADTNPLLHYILEGEALGRRPVPYFDPAWYRRQYDIPAGQTALHHFLRHRFDGRFSAIPEFDGAAYLHAHPDVRAAGMDPLEHYLVRGYAEGRAWSPGVVPPPARDGANPLLDLLERQRRAGEPDATPPTIASEVRRTTTAHAGFECRAPLPPGATPQAWLLAFYLPQFHPVAENDAFWGNGFTEWTNLQRALPRFAGHYQPRIPRDLGHYRLDQPGPLRQQAAMARAAGIHGFVFYHYWFDGRRLLDGPIEALMADGGIDLPFCLMWANENWTRRWDGGEDQVLLAQSYRVADEPALLDGFARCFADRRYIRLEGRPVLMIYRPRLIPDTAATIDRWRGIFRDRHACDPLFVMAQTFGDTDPRPFGMDAAVEFPPHKLTNHLQRIDATLDRLDPSFSAEVYDYAALAAASLAEPDPPYPLIKTALPGWDNDPRRQGAGMVMHAATPPAYQAWLRDLIHAARRNRVLGRAIVCINAWNEWAEGAYLEPDVHWGAAFLNATGRAAAGLAVPGERTRILLVGHDAHDHGAQTLLIHVARVLRAVHGVDVGFLLLAGGALLAQYEAVGPVMIAPDSLALATHAAAARAAGCSAALVNSAASAGTIATLDRHGIASVLLVHELPRIIRDKGLLPGLRDGAVLARRVVFAAGFVREHCHGLVALDPARTEILPQGIYKPAEPDALALSSGAAIRAELRVPGDAILAVGIGYADLRKGFDLFLQLWRAAEASGEPVYFAWAGGIDPEVANFLGTEIAAAETSGRFRYLGRRSDTGALLAAAQVFVLTSREDPLPSVVLEALSAGVPVVAFEETGGTPDLLARMQAGESVPLGDAGAMLRALLRQARAFGGARHAPRRAALAAAARTAFSFDAYCARLLALVHPALLPVSVVVLSCNYARYMPERLASIFAQTHPVREVIVLDDASDDDSARVASEVAAAWQRHITVECRAANSGSVFAQWRRAAERAQGDWIWIAEADDTCEPAFLASLAAAIGRAADPVLAFSDSRAIDAAGATVWDDYKQYYAQTAAGTLQEDGVFDGPAFLRSHMAERNLILNGSAVLWRRQALLDALLRAGPELQSLRMAGDWRLYAEALSQPGAQLAYVARPLNHHRRHDRSVTATLNPAAHAAEIKQVHAVLARLLGGDRGLGERQRRYRRGVSAAGTTPAKAQTRAMLPASRDDGRLPPSTA